MLQLSGRFPLLQLPPPLSLLLYLASYLLQRLFLRGVFHSRVLQWLFRTFIPTSWAMRFGLAWARHSRLKERDESYKGEHDEPLVLYAKSYLKEHPEVNLFIFGHRHIELDLMLSRSARLIVLGNCYSQFTYGVLDDNGFRLDNFA